MNLEKVIEIFNYVTGLVNSGETYLIDQMNHAIVFLNDLEVSVSEANTPKLVTSTEHPSKTDTKWVECFIEVMKGFLTREGFSGLSRQMVIDYFNNNKSTESLRHHVGCHHTIDSALSSEIIDIVEHLTNQRAKRV